VLSDAQAAGRFSLSGYCWRRRPPTVSRAFQLPRIPISRDLPWHQRQSALSKAFLQKGILVVVTAATPENAEQATNALERDLSKRSDLFRTVVQPDSGDFFQHTVYCSNLCPPSGNR
jgi:hypothetical protein